MEITKEVLEQLKKQYTTLYEGTLTFNDENDALHSVEFIYRKPLTADMEVHNKSAQRNPITANLNLIQTLIVYPDAGPVIEQIRPYPIAFSKFVEDAVSPFFGANAGVKSRKL